MHAACCVLCICVDLHRVCCDELDGCKRTIGQLKLEREQSNKRSAEHRAEQSAAEFKLLQANTEWQAANKEREKLKVANEYTIEEMKKEKEQHQETQKQVTSQTQCD